MARGPEGKFQDTVCAWLRKKGCRVIKNDPTTGRQKGIPDVTFFKDGFWGMMEFKASKRAKHQPGQDEWILWSNESSWGRFVYPECWDDIKEELEQML